MSARPLVAGIGNIFLGDDGFGVEVARRLAGQEQLAGVHVEDFGIRGVHLAYELLNGYDPVIMVDAAPRGGDPGTVYVIEAAPESEDGEEHQGHDALLDAHDLRPEGVLSLVRAMGGSLGRVYVVACEPSCVEERMGLSEEVAGAVDVAVRTVCDLATSKGQS
ncbi:hydrogenase maturation protease [Salinactinospora qingdaonensis]|uniref:Hydrogenase maturation protease n=1 Tax=Salinactinospora qingdaonensis TaxID=702744 RepID=A0ABP7FDM4_9ACTN